jgi:hypothetical protein
MPQQSHPVRDELTPDCSCSVHLVEAILSLLEEDAAQLDTLTKALKLAEIAVKNASTAQLPQIYSEL